MGDAHVPPDGHEPLAAPVPVIRRVVAARVRNPVQAEDFVQETLAKVMAARHRVERDTLIPYAVATARNLIVSAAQREQRARRNAYLLVESDDTQPRPEDEAVRRVDATVVNVALSRLSESDREVLLAHEVGGVDTAALAACRSHIPSATVERVSSIHRNPASRSSPPQEIIKRAARSFSSPSSGKVVSARSRTALACGARPTDWSAHARVSHGPGLFVPQRSARKRSPSSIRPQLRQLSK